MLINKIDRGAAVITKGEGLSPNRKKNSLVQECRKFRSSDKGMPRAHCINVVKIQIPPYPFVQGKRTMGHTN